VVILFVTLLLSSALVESRSKKKQTFLKKKAISFAFSLDNVITFVGYAKLGYDIVTWFWRDKSEKKPDSRKVCLIDKCHDIAMSDDDE